MSYNDKIYKLQDDNKNIGMHKKHNLIQNHYKKKKIEIASLFPSWCHFSLSIRNKKCKDSALPFAQLFLVCMYNVQFIDISKTFEASKTEGNARRRKFGISTVAAVCKEAEAGFRK